MVFQEEEEPIDAGFRIGYTVIDICGVVLHVLLFYAFLKDPLKCFKNFKMSFVINLGISDFLVCLSSLLKVLTRNTFSVIRRFLCHYCVHFGRSIFTNCVSY